MLETARAAEPGDVALSLRVLAEAWPDEGVGQVYATGGLVGGVAASVTVLPWLDAELEAGWRRLDAAEGGEETLQLMPVSLLAQAALPGDDVRPYVGLGPALVLFSERHPSGHEGPEAWAAAEADATAPLPTVISGGRVCGELRVGLRVDTDLVREPMPPAQGGLVRAVSLDLYLGRRLQNPLRGDEEGLRLSAWRAGVGLALGF